MDCQEKASPQSEDGETLDQKDLTEDVQNENAKKMFGNLELQQPLTNGTKVSQLLSTLRGLKDTEDMSGEDQQDVVNYLMGYVGGENYFDGNLCEFPPPNNDPPPMSTDLTRWQLDDVGLPMYIPMGNPPAWLRLTIPDEGFRCLSCSDVFYIESSFQTHMQRRSVWIVLECGPCDANLTFYNRCALKEHLYEHTLKGEEVDNETIEVRSLPLNLIRLAQPIRIPVPLSCSEEESQKRKSKEFFNLKKVPTKKSKLNQECNGDEKENYELAFQDADCDLFLHKGNKTLKKHSKVNCLLCNRSFCDMRALISHMRTDKPYSDQRVECCKCQLVLPSVCAAKAHILTHPPTNTANVSVCPECGSKCHGPRDFVNHLNVCGHQYRCSGLLCTQCDVCFFRSTDDFLDHWVKEHCGKSYQCVACEGLFETLVFHKCMSPDDGQVMATFQCLLTCPLCPFALRVNSQEEQDMPGQIRAHLTKCHPPVLLRVHYVFKSKFCVNAFRSKDQLRAHHDREHRRDNHYRTKPCTLHHQVMALQTQYLDGQPSNHTLISLPIELSSEELAEAQIRDVPTVSSIIDKSLFPDGFAVGVPVDVQLAIAHTVLSPARSKKRKRQAASVDKMLFQQHNANSQNSPVKRHDRRRPGKENQQLLTKLRPCVCYQCGHAYADSKDMRCHKRVCQAGDAVRHCQECHFSAVGRTFADHCLGHIEDGLIICIYCSGAQFESVEDLTAHFELHIHEQFTYPTSCPFCATILTDVSTALEHIREEHDSTNVIANHWQEPEDEVSLPIPESPAELILPVLGGPARNCQVCKKSMAAELFGRHLVGHLEEGLLVCSLCDGRVMPSSMALLHHLEEHTTAMAYPAVCPMCCLSLPTAVRALLHLKEEHGFGNLKCPECEMRYNFIYQLKHHTEIVHRVCPYAKRRYICWICRAYDHVKKETLINHFAASHGIERDCVDERAMIRTRGQGTMPTNYFIPTKPLAKEAGHSNSPSPNKSDSVRSRINSLQKSPEEKSPHRRNVTSVTLPPIANVNNINLAASLTSSSEAKMSKKLDFKLTSKAKVVIPKLLNYASHKKSSCTARKSVVKKNMVSAEVKKLKGTKKFVCHLCSFGTNQFEKYSKHKKKHEFQAKVEEGCGSEEFKCSICDALFVVKPSLDKHMFFVHKERKKSTGGTVSADEEGDKVGSAAVKLKETTIVKKRAVVKTSQFDKSRSARSRKSTGTKRKKAGALKKRNTVRKQMPELSSVNAAEMFKVKPVVLDSDFQSEDETHVRKKCSVCGQEFDDSVTLYSHLRTHGMAFLKMGQNTRSASTDKA